MNGELTLCATCLKILRENSRQHADRSRGRGSHANHENFKLDRAYKHLNSALPKSYFRQKFTASPCGADALARELRNLSAALANQNLVVGYAQLGTPLLARSQRPEAM